MNVIMTLMRRHLLETRWQLGLSAGAFFGLSILTNWIVLRYQRLVETDPELAFERYRFMRGLGGAAFDYSTTAMQVCWFNHPIIFLTVLSWSIARGSSAVAGEIERGTIDVTLSRPISRVAYLASQVIYTVVGLVVLAGAIVAGNLAGGLYFGLKSPASLMTLLKPGTMLVALGLSVFGYTLPFSTFDVVRWRPTLAGAAITLGGLMAMTIAPQFESVKWLEKLSVFQAYAPVTVALKGDSLVENVLALCGVFAVGLVLSFWAFTRRDLPSNS